ncbi:MAG: histidine phosphatase family protein [Deltaproteobacteria bacterium]|nr:histidine phosphatase family protein [Deltaproteobacteria bacterium]
MTRAWCVGADEPLGQRWLADDDGARQVFLVRHGEALHQERARSEALLGRVCRCHDVGGDPTGCPYLSDDLIDDPLTDEGRAQSARAGIVDVDVDVDIVWAAACRRSLQTALLALPSVRCVAREELRARVGPHRHSWRSPRSTLVREFPAVDFDAVDDDDDLARWSGSGEPRASLHARASAFVGLLLQRPERRVAVVTHFTLLLALFRAPGDPFVIGALQNDDDDGPLLDCSRSAEPLALAELIAVGACRSLVLVPR